MKVKNTIRACALPLCPVPRPREWERVAAGQVRVVGPKSHHCGEGRGEVSIFAALLHRLARVISFVAHRNPPVQLALDLDQVTESGLPLREALPVRSAEYWLQLGAPDIALQELERFTAKRKATLPVGHPEPLRIEGGRFWLRK